MKQNISIVVPCYNEENRIDLDQFSQFSKDYPEFSFCFVDDGSTDQTRSRIEGFITKNACAQLSIFSLDKNGGKAEAVRQGLQFLVKRDSAVEFVGFCDADLATPLIELKRMFDYFHRHPEIDSVLGSRTKLLGRSIRRKLLRHYISRVFATLSSVLLELPIYDTQCGAKIFKRSLAEATTRESFQSKWLFDVEWILRMLHYYSQTKTLSPENFADHVHEYPLHSWTHREDSKIKFVDFLRVPFEIIKIWRLKKKTLGRYFFALPSSLNTER